VSPTSITNLKRLIYPLPTCAQAPPSHRRPHADTTPEKSDPQGVGNTAGASAKAPRGARVREGPNSLLDAYPFFSSTDAFVLAPSDVEKLKVMSAGTGGVVPASDLTSYLMPITYVPGVGTVICAAVPPLISVI